MTSGIIIYDNLCLYPKSNPSPRAAGLTFIGHGAHIDRPEAPRSPPPPPPRGSSRADTTCHEEWCHCTATVEDVANAFNALLAALKGVW